MKNLLTYLTYLTTLLILPLLKPEQFMLSTEEMEQTFQKEEETELKSWGETITRNDDDKYS